MKTSNRESGRIIIFVLVTVLTLSAFWFIALGVTGSELRIVGGKKSAAQEFFDAEAAINISIGNLYNSTSSLYNSAPLYNSVITIAQKDALNREIGVVEIRPIQNQSAVPGLPFQAHEFTPPAGSGSGVNTTRARRYAIGAISGKKEIQVGVYRIVTKAN